MAEPKSTKGRRSKGAAGLFQFEAFRSARPVKNKASGRGTKIVLKQGSFKSLASKKRTVTAFLTNLDEAVRRSEEAGKRVRLTIEIGRNDAPKVDIEELEPSPAAKTETEFEAALAEALERGARRAAEILDSPEMLSSDEFAKLIGVTREAVRLKRKKNEVLGLEGAKRGVKYPRWQVTSDGRLLPELPALFEKLGGDPWSVYRFLRQHHPEVGEMTALDALKRGQVTKVLNAADNAGMNFS